MKKAYELATLTGTQVLLLVASETGHVYTFATNAFQPIISKPDGKALIQQCLGMPDRTETCAPTPFASPFDDKDYLYPSQSLQSHSLQSHSQQSQSHSQQSQSLHSQSLPFESQSLQSLQSLPFESQSLQSLPFDLKTYSNQKTYNDNDSPSLAMQPPRKPLATTQPQHPAFHTFSDPDMMHPDVYHPEFPGWDSHFPQTEKFDLLASSLNDLRR